MKKIFLVFTLTVTLLGLPSVSLAQSLKAITLKDGSLLKGKVIELHDGIYTVETSDLGRITIPESTILSITPVETATPVYQGSKETGGQQKVQLKTQVEHLQGSILGDPELMGEIQNILKDQEVQSLLSDPKLLEDVLSYDQEKIQNNDNVQDLLNNEKMQDLIKKVYQKIPRQ